MRNYDGSAVVASLGWLPGAEDRLDMLRKLFKRTQKSRSEFSCSALKRGIAVELLTAYCCARSTHLQELHHDVHCVVVANDGVAVVAALLVQCWLTPNGSTAAAVRVVARTHHCCAALYRYVRIYKDLFIININTKRYLKFRTQ